MVLPFIAQVSLSMSRQPAACLARFVPRPLLERLAAAAVIMRPQLQPAHSVVGPAVLTVTELHAAPALRLQQRLAGQSAQPSQQQWPLFSHYLATAATSSMCDGMDPPPLFPPKPCSPRREWFMRAPGMAAGICRAAQMRF